MIDPQSICRIAEMLHAIKIFIETANRLTPEDIKGLEQVVAFMERPKEVRIREMTISEIERVLGYPIKIVKET